jgi:hypothetical protein
LTSHDEAWPKKKVWRLVALVSVLLLAAALAMLSWSGAFVSYESPNYRVVDRIDSVEIREYDGYLVAQTEVDGDLEGAGNRGFRVLARYIFGDNRSGAKVEMTAPVTQRERNGDKIAMTTPVTQKAEQGKYILSFMMPSEYTRDSLPVPNDPRITIAEVPPKTLAAVRYSGTWSKRNYQKHLDRLQSALRGQGYEPEGEPVWARYNPPFTPWFMRRNEILTSFRATTERR